MRGNMSRIIKSILLIGILGTMLSTSIFAAWWGTPGYEWAKEKKLTSLANNSALNNPVSLDNLYSVVIKYLEFKKIKPKESIMQNVGDSNCFNKGLEAMLDTVDLYITKDSLTPAEYRIVSTYIIHAVKTLQEQAGLLTRDNLKNIYLYLSLAEYKAATLIDDYSYKTLILSKMGAVKYKDLVKYNIKPYYGEISRKEFLLLMFSLLSNQSVSEDDVLKQFDESGVIEGYNDDLMLTKQLTYAEMFTFLRRFEVFEFNPVIDENGEASGDEVVEIK